MRRSLVKFRYDQRVVEFIQHLRQELHCAALSQSKKAKNKCIAIKLFTHIFQNFRYYFFSLPLPLSLARLFWLVHSLLFFFYFYDVSTVSLRPIGYCSGRSLSLVAASSIIIISRLEQQWKCIHAGTKGLSNRHKSATTQGSRVNGKG